jgi:MIP family channel proteins
MRSRGVTEGAGAAAGGGGGSRKVPRRERASTPDSLRVVWQKFTSEFIGTFVFLLLGLCATTSSVITGAQSGIWQGAVVWGIAVSLAIYATSDVSGAHINPAVSLAMAVMKPDTEFSWFQCAYYIIAQVLGSIAAAAVNYAMWSNFIHDYESKNNIDRGSPGSEVSAMVFCDYFPNASLYPPQESEHLMSPLGAVVIETLATALLLFFIFAVSDPHNKAALPAPGPILIGGAVAIIISTIGPLTQAGLNPARDFGPRVVAWLAGWDSIAFPGPQNGFWVYIVGPFAGGPLGALLYTHILHARREDNHRTSRVSLDASDRRFDFLDNK